MARLLAALGLIAVPQVVAQKILMVLTSHNVLGEKKGNATGWYLPEAAHPYKVFSDSGMDMVWASPKGGEAPVDPGSVETYTNTDQADDACKDFMTKNKDVWGKTKKLSDVADKDFDAVFVVGGYGVMWDLVKDNDLAGIVAKIYEEEGIVSAVCHGPAALVNVKLSDGTPLVKGKTVSCFTNEEEDAMGLRTITPKTCEDAYTEASAKFSKGGAWTDHVTIDGRIITGQNPMSAKTTAEEVVKALKKDDTQEKADLRFSVETPVKSSKANTFLGVIGVGCLGAVTLALTLRAYRQGQPQSVDESPMLEDALE